MKKFLQTFSIFSVILLLISACSMEEPGSNNNEANNNGENKNATKDATIGLSISTLNNPFFVTLRDGAEEEAENEGVELVTSDAQDDPSKQLSDIEDLIQQDVDVLLINPVDSEAITSAVELANDADIPVVTVDRDAEGGDVVTHIASDNVAGGEIAAEYIVNQIGEEGEIVELEGISGSSTTRERGEGFYNVMDELDDMEIVASQSADFDRTEGLSVMENIIESQGEIDALFAHNDEMALGAVEALDGHGLLDDVVVVGFDATDDAVEAVEDGKMDATIAQQPDLIGEASIEAAVQIINGEDLDDYIPVDLELVSE